MKKIIGILWLSLSANAFANGPMLVKTQESGFTPEEWRSFQRCEIYLDRVEITAGYGTNLVAVNRIFPVSIDAGIQDLIVAASQETFTSDSTLCDASSTLIYAMDYSGPTLPTTIDLYAFSSCNQDGERNGPASSHLRKIVETLCD